MKNKVNKIFIVFLIIFSLAAITGSFTKAQSQEYYPNASPTHWYILPGQSLGFVGNGFAPGEMVMARSITGTKVLGARADINGNWATPTKNVPYFWQSSSQTFYIKGDVSNKEIPITIYVGNFYPQIYPSTYWIGVNQPMSVQANAFAPGETIRLFVKNIEVGSMPSDSSGNANFNFTTPATGSSFTLKALGALSGRSSSRTIYMHTSRGIRKKKIIRSNK